MMPSVLRSSGEKPILCLTASARRPQVQRRAVDGDRAGVERVRAEDGARRLGAPGPEQAGQPDDLAGADRHRDPVEGTATAQVDRLQHRRPVGERAVLVGAPVRELLGQLTAEHRGDQLVAADLRHRATARWCARRA